MLKLDIANRKIVKFLQVLPAKHFKQVLLKIVQLQKDPFPNDSQKLKGDDAFRTDIGEYRIIYTVENEDTLTIWGAGKRNDGEVYKKYGRSEK